ncbi:E3 ubiquitin-protein ligase TRIM45 isoform X2 [Anoplolepis gracilipes]|uniref:E3 ubiquitin-protein ligase TRIM45 isoform X2 n=1 Tax=Anoplolepis gracilipes TaxID=354296 RepID=UPI003BA21095
MDLINCSTKWSAKSCCSHEAVVDSDFESYDHIYASLVECKKKDINTEVNVESMRTINKCNEENFGKKHVPWSTNSNIFTYQPSPVFPRKMSEVYEEPREITGPYKSHDLDFQCPRCGQRMEEPRLLPCLHPICLACVYELMSKPSYISLKNEIRNNNNQMYRRHSIHETCPLCDSHLPNINSTIPPPHYPLQHRLVMDTMRRKLVNRVLCDTCTSEVLALIQCSTCLRNFCSECGRQHEQQNMAEARTIKHLMRPLWEATKIRRTILCQTHPMHVLRFYCIACQQVTCKECMWSAQHRGHASEDALGVGKRASAYLVIMLQKARIFLNTLLIQYNHVFSNNGSEELQNETTTYRYVYFYILN